MPLRYLLLSALLGAACGGQGTLELGFSPSNLPFGDLPSAQTDLELSADKCGSQARIDTNTGNLFCRPGTTFISPSFPYVVQLVSQTDGGGEVLVLAARGFRIAPGVNLNVVGTRPLVILALHGLTVEGTITAVNSNNYYTGEAGGPSEPSGNHVAGAGSGGGAPGSGVDAGAGGGSYCGRGGKGGDDTSAGTTGGAGGPLYGNAELIPLLPGSSGGKNGNHAGAGGGAVQLLAGTRLTVGAFGKVNLGGRGGGWAGNGGGSGGAILAEAPEVFIEGVLAVNGGGGGSGGSGGGERPNGDDALPAGDATLGGLALAPNTDGGSGSSATSIDGASAASTTGQAGGGGGGAGRIRINTYPDAPPAISGTLSPAIATGCASTGVIAPRP